MKKKKPFVILFILLFITTLSSCRFFIKKPHVLPQKQSQKEYLEKIYSTKKPEQLREIFNHYSKLDFSREEDNNAVSTIAKYINLFSNKFIVIELEEKEGPSCGKVNYFTILIESSSKNILVWGVYIYLDEKKRNRICRIQNFGQRDGFDFLRKYQEYWI